MTAAEPWKIVYTKNALKDKKIAYEEGFGAKTNQLLDTIRGNPSPHTNHMKN